MRSHLAHPWQVERDTGVTIYEACPLCGKRKAWQRVYGKELIDECWLKAGLFDPDTPADVRPPAPPPDLDGWSMKDVYGARPKHG